MARYLLRLKVPINLQETYAVAVAKHNAIIDTQKHFDAGFDLLCPREVIIDGFETQAIDHFVKGSMEFFPSAAEDVSLPVGYFLYPRSSTGLKTPLRLANSVGVIDAGYRGNYLAVFDNWRFSPFKVDQLQRLVQICAPNLTYPMKVELVEELGEMTLRGEGGFGSSGK